MNASTSHRPPLIHASPFDKAARSENEFPPNPPQEVHYEAKPLSSASPIGSRPSGLSRGLSRIRCN